MTKRIVIEVSRDPQNMNRIQTAIRASLSEFTNREVLAHICYAVMIAAKEVEMTPQEEEAHAALLASAFGFTANAHRSAH